MAAADCLIVTGAVMFVNIADDHRDDRYKCDARIHQYRPELLVENPGQRGS